MPSIFDLLSFVGLAMICDSFTSFLTSLLSSKLMTCSSTELVILSYFRSILLFCVLYWFFPQQANIKAYTWLIICENLLDHQAIRQRIRTKSIMKWRFLFMTQQLSFKRKTKLIWKSWIFADILVPGWELIFNIKLIEFLK